MRKKEIRKYIKPLNRALTHSEREEYSCSIFTKIEELEIFNRSQYIALYLSLEDEPSSREAIERWSAMGKSILLPKLNGEQMEFYPYTAGEQFTKGAFGIDEPNEGTLFAPHQIELMVIPGVAFCHDGRRLGRGRGYYDRYLKRCSKSCYKIGVGYTHQLTADIPCEEHDVIMELIITP